VWQWVAGAATALGLGILLSSACSDRATSEEPPVDRQVKLCQDFCTLDPACGHEPHDPDETNACVESCLDQNFRAPNTPCSVVAERFLEACRKTYVDSCEFFEAPECEAAELPVSVCRVDPQAWAAHDCDDKCPGDCCDGQK
jgi:hypothetical protein